MVRTRLPPTFTGGRGGLAWAWTAPRIAQLQKAIPVAAAPAKKLRRVVIHFLPRA